MISPALLDLARIRTEWAERKLTKFIEQAWPILEPGSPYLPNWHIDAIADYLQGVSAGHILRLLINMPPRALKTWCVTQAWPVWEWGPQDKPSTQFMMTSYDAKLSSDHSLNRRILIESDWYQERWGGRFELSADQNTKALFTNDKRGRMFATSMTGAGTGFGCDKLIVDDPHNPKKAESELERKAAVKAFRQQFATRLNNKKTGAIVIVMQRLHADDLSAHALEMGYTHLCLEGVCSKRRYILLPSTMPPGHPISCDCSVCYDDQRKQAAKAGLPKPPEERDPPAEGKSIKRERGEYLHEKREGEKEHAAMRAALGSAGYAGQYDQRPNPEGGTKFKRIWFQYFKDAGDHYELHGRCGKIKRVLKKQCRKFSTVDTAMSEEQTADFTAILDCAVTPENDLLFTDMIRDRLEDPDVDRLIRAKIVSGRVSKVCVEKKANGTALVQAYVREGLPVKALACEGDKVSRATKAALLMENGKIYFAADAPWLVEYEQELLQFPNGAHDDQVDTTSYAGIEVSDEIVLDMPKGQVRAVSAS